MTAHYRMVLSACLLGLVAACSAVDYQKPVSTFSAATENATNAMVALNQQVTQSYADRIRTAALNGNTLIKAKDGDCELTSDRCRLVTVKSDRSEELFVPDPVLGNIVALMRQIDAYAKGLTDIVNADTAAKVAAHVNSTLGSVENLAKTVDGLADSNLAGNVTAYKTSVGKLVNWLVGKYVANVQVSGLRRATEAADPVIMEAASIFKETAAIAAVISVIGPQKKFEVARQKFEDDEGAGRAGNLERNLNAMASTAAAYDRILLAKPSSVFAKLGEAHAALTASLHDDDVSLVTALAKIEVFAAEAQALIDIVREISAVNPD